MAYPHFTPSQLTSLRKASQIAAQTFQQIKKIIQPGWTEKQTATKINKIMKDLGAERLAFRTIVASGRHTAKVHHKNTTRKIRKKDIVLLDFGCKVRSKVPCPERAERVEEACPEPVEGCSDFSRTIFIGTPKPQWRKIFSIVSTAQLKAIKFLNTKYKSLTPNLIKASKLDSIARNYITKKGYGKHFPHGLGHGIGSKVHQYFKIGPKSKAYLKSGFVFTIEPAIYLKGKFGVRLEDVIHLSPKGPQILTKL